MEVEITPINRCENTGYTTSPMMGEPMDIAQQHFHFNKADFDAVVHHVFLPKKLPQSESEKIEKDEGNLLCVMTDTIQSLGSNLPESTINLFKTWASLQSHSDLNPSKVNNSLLALKNRQMLALYIRKQNCGLIFSTTKESDDYIIMSTFPASLKNEIIVSSPYDINVSYPQQSIKIPISHLLASDVFAQKLSILHATEMEDAMPKSQKSRREVVEVRDVAETIFISQWLTAALSDENSTVCLESEFPRIIKKVRDEVLWEGATLPFRRSGFWMTIKVTLELNLKMEFGDWTGKFMYKLIMASLMTRICEFWNSFKTLSVNDLDVAMQMLAKLARRLEKLKLQMQQQLENPNAPLLIELYTQIHQTAADTIARVRKRLDTQFEYICNQDMKTGQLKPLQDLDFKRDIIHTASKIQKYIKMREMPPMHNTADKHLEIHIRPRHRSDNSTFPAASLLIELNVNDEVQAGFILRDIENWIHLHLKTSSATAIQIREMAFSYALKAKSYYEDDPLGSSQMILALLKMIQHLDIMSCEKFPMLRQHRCGVNAKIVEHLLLPSRIDLERADELESYFLVRDDVAHFPGLVEEDRISQRSFSVRFATHNEEMQDLKKEILRKANEKIEAKRKEVATAKAQLVDWRKQWQSMSCEYNTGYDRHGNYYRHHRSGCSNCAMEKRINNYRVNVYERPLRNEDFCQNAVAFELIIPEEISCLRDLLNLLAFDFCTNGDLEKLTIKGLWTSHHELSSYRLNTQKRVYLGSSSTLFVNTHYTCKEQHPDYATDDNIIVDCGYNCTFYGQNHLPLSRNIQNDSVKYLCTYTVEQGSPYENLQWALGGTTHTQNQILAKQSQCDQKLSLAEYVEYGTLRVGHRLQIRNIYRAMETNKLAFKNQSVVSLILQALWETGPHDPEKQLRESHQDFSEDSVFTEKMIDLLTSFISLQENNWNDLNNLLVVILITTRILEMNLEDCVIEKGVKLLLKCRRVSLDWISKIEIVLSRSMDMKKEDISEMRNNLIDVAVCCSLTFFVDAHSKAFPQIFATVDDIPSENAWLNSVVKCDNNILLNSTAVSHIPNARRNLLRMVRCTGVNIENQLNVIIRNESSNLNEFARSQWAGAKGGRFYSWRPEADPQIYFTNLTDFQGSGHRIQLDLILGKFLVDGNPVSRLPDVIMNHNVFTRVFGTGIFEVQPTGNLTNKSFCTILKYSGSNYSFSMLGQDLIITEQQENGDLWELLPHHNFCLEFPPLLVDNYSHWWNRKMEIIHFKPKNFSDPLFFSSDSIHYTFYLSTKYLIENKSKRYFADITRTSFNKISQHFTRLEDVKYIHVLVTITDAPDDSPHIEVEIPRMALHFHLNENLQLISREYMGKMISLQQTTGTLIGLQNGLLLTNLDSSHHSEQNLLIVPHGKIKKNLGTTFICLDSLREPTFFTYEVNQRFQQLKAGKSYAAWVYLAHLHGVTSLPLPNPFTGVTGTERALKILQSGWCWSSEPFDKETDLTLNEIQKLSPTRSYYPKHLKSMESVKWPNHMISSASHELYLPIVNQLISDSQKLNFLFGDGAKFPKKECNLLTKRAYWRHECYNPNYKITETFARNILIKDCSVNFPCPIPTSHLPLTEMTILASLVHNWSFVVPQESRSLLRQLLEINEKLNGVLSVRFEYLDINDWLNLDLCNRWLDLYNFSRQIQNRQLQSSWRLWLSLLSFKGKDSDDLFILHAVATNPEAFQNIDPPSYKSYANPHQQTFNRDEIINILSNKQIGEDKFLTQRGYGSNRSYYDDSDRKRIAALRTEYSNDLVSQRNGLADAIEKKWPCKECSYYDINNLNSSLIILVDALGDINNLLKKWYANRELGIFLQNVADKLNELAENQNGERQLKTASWEQKNTLTIPDGVKFNINYKDKMTQNLNSSLDIRKIVTDVERIYRSGNLLCPWNSDQQNFRSQLKFYENQRYFYWEILTRLILPFDEKYLLQSGLYPRIVPTILLPMLVDSEARLSLQMKPLLNIIGCVGVVFSLEMRASRIVKLQRGGLQTEIALQREIEAIPHENWSPFERPEWLLFELEMDMTIRRIQVEVAAQMMNPPGSKHSVMQLNMGEGKTAVIVPILATTLANGKQLCRVTVLKSLFRTNLGSLRHCLGGMLNRRIYTFPCRRDLKIDEINVKKIIQSYHECQQMKGIVMTLPEYRLSFQLKAYETARNGHLSTSTLFLEAHNWLNAHARDILDESDEILHAKYQLIYTVGEQLHPGGGNLRWTIIQSLLKILPTEIEKLWKKYGDGKIEFNSDFSEKNGPHIFSPCRLLCDDVYEELIQALTDKFMAGETAIQFPPLQQIKAKIVRDFITDTNISQKDHKEAVESMFQDSASLRDTILILAGYLKYEVLRLALTKRWRVNYGVNTAGLRKMAIPFKAKDVAAEMTEFGHPDVAICLTHFSYYYSGLTHEQMLECFLLLEKIPNPGEHYQKWISNIPSAKVHDSIRSYEGVNLKDSFQRLKHLFPVLEKNMYVIDFWLNNVVFPREAKQFAAKMMCTAWDLVSEEQTCTISGFSGTNDSKLLLPLPIKQNDLTELENTNENVRNTLLLAENDDYEALPPNVSGRQILKKLVEKQIPVLLDSGALMLELNNYEVATEWLKIIKEDSTLCQIKAAVYFDTNNVLMVVDGLNQPREFDLSPFRERLDLCVIYLDDAHTRGTDLKFPRGTKACVTLAGGITRDKTVQACMRMRMLGKGHTVCFFGSQEADNSIKKFSLPEGNISTKDVVNWICNNSRIFEKDGLVHWSAAGHNYAQKCSAHFLFKEKNRRLLQEMRNADESFNLDLELENNLHIVEENMNIDENSNMEEDILGSMDENIELEENEEEIYDPEIESLAPGDKILIQLSNLCSEKELIDLMIMYGELKSEEKISLILTSRFQFLINKFKQLSKNSIIFNRLKAIQTNILSRINEHIPDKKRFSQLLDEEQEKELEHELEEERQLARPGPAIPYTPSIDLLLKQFLQTGSDQMFGNLIRTNSICKLPFAFEKAKLWNIAQPNGWSDRIFVTRNFVSVIKVQNPSDKVDEFLRPVYWMTGFVLNEHQKLCLLLLSPFEANDFLPIFGPNKIATLHMYAPRLHPEHDNLLNTPQLQIPSKRSLDNAVFIERPLQSQLAAFSGSTYFQNKQEQDDYCNFLGLIPQPRSPYHQEEFDNFNISPSGFVKPELRGIISAEIASNCRFTENPDLLIRGIVERRHDLFPASSHAAQIVIESKKTFRE